MNSINNIIPKKTLKVKFTSNKYWIQCIKCDKWRIVKLNKKQFEKISHPDYLWDCSQNTDKQYASCNAPGGLNYLENKTSILDYDKIYYDHMKVYRNIKTKKISKKNDYNNIQFI